MTVTQVYKTITLSQAQMTELANALSDRLALTRREIFRADAVDLADELQERERTLMNIQAVLVLP